MRPSWRNLQMSLIMVNLFILGWDTVKIGVLESMSSLVIGFQKMGWSRISSISVHVGNLLVVKFCRALNNCIRKSLLFCFCKLLCLGELRICVSLNRAKPWLELNIKFNWYSRRFFQRALVVFNNLWIHLISKEFNWVSMSKIYLTELSKWGVCLMKILYSFLNFFWIYFGIVYIWAVYHRFNQRIRFTVIFFLSKREPHSVPNMNFSC